MHITQNAAIADSADLALNTAEQTTWTIVGSGAIGLLAASNAALKGSPKVQLALRPQNSVGTSFAFSFCAGQQEYPILLSSITKTTPIQALLLPVKAYAVADALKTYLPNLTKNAQIVLCHNGMGTIEQVLPLLSAEQGLWFASTTHGAYKSTPLRVVHSGQGKTILGAVNQVAKSMLASEKSVAKNEKGEKDEKETISSAIAQMLGPCEVVDDILPFLWQKLAINLVINSLTAIHNVRNGALAGADYQAVIGKLVSEFVEVAKHSGQVFTPEQLQQQIAQVITATAENYSSMLQDVKNGRQLEAAYISGYLLEQGVKHLLDLPTIRQINQALNSLNPAKLAK